MIRIFPPNFTLAKREVEAVFFIRMRWGSKFRADLLRVLKQAEAEEEPAPRVGALPDSPVGIGPLLRRLLSEEDALFLEAAINLEAANRRRALQRRCYFAKVAELFQDSHVIRRELIQSRKPTLEAVIRWDLERYGLFAQLLWAGLRQSPDAAVLHYERLVKLLTVPAPVIPINARP